MKAKVPPRALLVRFLMHPVGKTLLALFILTNLTLLGGATYFLYKYSKLVDQKLRAGPFASTSMIFAAPGSVAVGDQTNTEEIITILRRAGYTEARTNKVGWYHVRADAIEVFPGPNSYFEQEAGVIKFNGPKVAQIISLGDNSERNQYSLEPELITNLFDRNREKRRIVHFSEIPPLLVHAVVSAEDKRFFQHSGFDPLRIIKAGMRDVREGRKAEGASTLSQQVARMFWLDQQKTWRRKVSEMLVTLLLEQKLTKEQIFEYYVNQVPLGRRGSFSINGIGEASAAFFNKDLSQITLPEAALIAGSIQRPSFTNPFKWADRARQRRNVILWMMRENKYITDREYEQAIATPVKVTGGNAESTDAPYFVDLINDTLQTEYENYDFQKDAYRVYTTLDLNLQHIAAEAVRTGMLEVDEALRRVFKKDGAVPEAQVCLIALDPISGEVKALVGGRDYGASQLDRALAKRQPGSSFKPFVYAAALSTALNQPAAPADGEEPTAVNAPITPLTTLIDEPTTFYNGSQPYTPKNHNGDWSGMVTLRQALAKSMNIPAVKLAEMVGYRKVVDLARRAGLNMDVRPTPAVALGAYEVTPLEIAGAYTMFANKGVVTKPSFIGMIRDRRGAVIAKNSPQHQQVLDPRVNFLMVDMMQEVLRSGTGAGVRTRGFSLPAAGKTGSSRDGWFAGFTSKLVCIVWVGIDGGSDLRLEGAKSALPVWTEFMKKAHQLREYRGVQPFAPPDGVVSVQVDPTSGQLAIPACPAPRNEYFLSGTQPVEACKLHGGSGTLVSSWDMLPTQSVAAADAGSQASGKRRDRNNPQTLDLPPTTVPDVAPAAGSEKPREKRGLFGKIRDIFK